MGLNRRDFLKTLGVAGGTLVGADAFASTGKADGEAVEFKSILVDITRCEGCQGCEIACAEANGLPEPEDYPEVGVQRALTPERLTVINAYDTSKGEVYVKRSCMHCNQPACASACLTKAMYKTKEGPVIWRESKCMGCRYCMMSCPFDVPTFEWNDPNPKINKCQMCFESLAEGEWPACVEYCPNEALVFGTRRELLAEAHRRIAMEPEVYYNHVYGEDEAGGTGVLYLSPVPFEEVGFKTDLDKKPYPELTKGFLYSVSSIFVLWPAMLLGLHQANNGKDESAEIEQVSDEEVDNG